MTTSPAPLRVLLLTHDESHATQLRTDLSRSGRAVIEPISTLAAATAALDSGGVDAVVVDIGSSGGFDLATLDRLREAAGDRVPAVVLTAESDESLADQAIERGAQDYLVKGHTDADLLVRSVRYARERSRWRRETLRQEAALLQAHKMEAIGRLAGGVAHDFNNVLTAIFGYSDLLLEQFPPEDPRRADLQEIRKSAERAAALTHQLLTFSRKQLLQPRVLNVNDVVAGLQKLLARLVGEDVVLEVRTEEALWPVCADPGQLEQVLMNLAANARDAMPEGGRISVETANVEVAAATAARPGLRPGAYVTLTVADTGSGIPESVRTHMFEPFFTTKDPGKGTGLGLATVYGIVKQSGGGVYVDGEEGTGARFVIYLPRVP